MGPKREAESNDGSAKGASLDYAAQQAHALGDRRPAHCALSICCHAARRGARDGQLQPAGVGAVFVHRCRIPPGRSDNVQHRPRPGPRPIYSADDTNDYNFEGIVSFSPTARLDADIPDGAILGTQQSFETVGVINNPCVITIALQFTLMDATTDITKR